MTTRNEQWEIPQPAWIRVGKSASGKRKLTGPRIWKHLLGVPHQRGLGPRFGQKCFVQPIVPAVFAPVLAKHSKSFSLIDCVSVGGDRMQRNFEPMRKQVEAWQQSELTDVTAKVVITRRSWRASWRQLAAGRKLQFAG